MCISIILLFVCSTAVAQRSDKSLLYSRASISTLIMSLLMAYLGTNLYFLDKGLSLFNGIIHNTCITSTFHWFIILVSCIILQLTSSYPRKIWLSSDNSSTNSVISKIKVYTNSIINKFSEQYKILEYSLIILFVIMGGTFLMASSDLVCIFLCIELQSYGLYILCTSYRNSERSTSAGLTYFLLGALSSCFILLGSGLLYGNSGNTLFDSLFIISDITSYLDNISNWYVSTYLISSLIVFSVGFLFKISAAPFHFWSPDVYDAIPTIVTTFVAVFAKISILVLLLELIHHTTNLSTVFVEDFSLIKDTVASTINNMVTYSTNSGDKLQGWIFIFIISSLLSLIIGSVLGLTQFRIKRLYAYSTISHLGFILLALSINSLESIQSFIFYLTQYSLANLNAFFILIAIGYSLFTYVKTTDKLVGKKLEHELEQELENKTIADTAKENLEIEKVEQGDERERNNSPIQLVNEIKGYFFINPTLAISLTITLFSFVGIPPLVGFFAKQMVLSAALDNGYIFITLVAILTSVISAYYYLAVVKQIFFFNSDYTINPQLKNVILKGIISKDNKPHTSEVSSYYTNINVSLSSFLSITISVLTLIILLFIFTPQEWLSLGSILSIIIFNN